MPKEKKPSTKRTMFAFDFSPAWKRILNESVLPLYATEYGTASNLIREVVREFIASHVSEAQMRSAGILQIWKGKPRAELLEAAVKEARKNSGARE